MQTHLRIGSLLRLLNRPASWLCTISCHLGWVSSLCERVGRAARIVRAKLQDSTGGPDARVQQ